MNFMEAISLVEELECEGEITKDMVSFVHAQVGFLLLFDLHFEEAVNHFLQSDTMQPSEVFPFIMRDPNRWSLLVYLLMLITGWCIHYFVFNLKENYTKLIDILLVELITREIYSLSISKSLKMNINKL